MAPLHPEKAWSIIVGSLYVAFGQVLFATNDIIVSLTDLNISQLVIGRYTIQFLIAILWWTFNQPSNTINWYGDHPNINNIFIRGIFFSLNTIFTWYAVKRCPVADMIAIYELSIVLTALYGRIQYREKCPKFFLLIVILTVSGILFISMDHQKYMMLFQLNELLKPLNIDGVIAMIIAAICWSLSTVLIRGAKNSHFLQLEIVSAGQTALITIPLTVIINAYFTNNAILGRLTGDDWKLDINSCLIMILIGFLGFTGISLTVIGFQKGDSTKVVWVMSLGVVIAVIYQTVLFGDMFNFYEGFGILLILLAVSLTIGEQWLDYNKAKKVRYIAVNLHFDTTDDEKTDGNEDERVVWNGPGYGHNAVV